MGAGEGQSCKVTRKSTEKRDTVDMAGFLH